MYAPAAPPTTPPIIAPKTELSPSPVLLPITPPITAPPIAPKVPTL